MLHTEKDHSRHHNPDFLSRLLSALLYAAILLMMFALEANGESLYWDALDQDKLDEYGTCKCRCLSVDEGQLCLELYWENDANRLDNGPCAYWYSVDQGNQDFCEHDMNGNLCTGSLKTEDGWEERVKGYFECNWSPPKTKG